MRLRILTASPLPEVKAWFNVDTASTRTITDLKRRICDGVVALNDAHVLAKDLILLLDDFELLDASPLDILRDGDLMCIKTSSLKRKGQWPYLIFSDASCSMSYPT